MTTEKLTGTKRLAAAACSLMTEIRLGISMWLIAKAVGFLPENDSRGQFWAKGLYALAKTSVEHDGEIHAKEK